MLTPTKENIQEHRWAPNRGSGSALAFIAVLVASCLTIFVSMMFITGAAQRGVIPRVKKMMEPDVIEVKAKENTISEMPKTKPKAPPVKWESAPWDSIRTIERWRRVEEEDFEGRMSRLEGLLQVRLSESLATSESLTEEERVSRLVKIFSGMKPLEAARVLSGLTNAEAELLLTQMSPRQASKVLGALEPGRAARLSKRVLGLAPEPEVNETTTNDNRWYEEEAW
ncbi:MAG: hypothetical protein KJ970_14760 [Candidatus Eisenbacteria bacterium]|uniref:Magnesium transporter MgtE intracellular domain-containing protein n=1 Tax=Eiseniibacteriota bacterium TaxID=2212470 RepID=A0A948RW81_UNCEI|nr:hypothetical protein [Candidatus Eisenbacteria bacterium]MBU1950947.1 hypothetical protein [Candidatus Eisenbacteria bacterium]MBU2692180.1 hypothetical protein [Candidatus Eisenbacteria bacterium]